MQTEWEYFMTNDCLDQKMNATKINIKANKRAFTYRLYCLKHVHIFWIDHKLNRFYNIVFLVEVYIVSKSDPDLRYQTCKPKA